MNWDNLKSKYLYYRELTDYKLLPNSYVMVMLDGRSFSKKIKKKFHRPFDDEFITMMNETAKYVCEKVSGCKLAYVQSDEINLVLYDTQDQEPFFGNRLCKMQSIIASLATSKFNQLMYARNLIEKSLGTTEYTRYPQWSEVAGYIAESPLYEFDCKVWNVPNVNEAFAAILYRQNDCVRNSKEQAAQTYFPHSELWKKTTDTQVKMLREKFGIDWVNEYNDGEKYGRFVKRIPFEYDELDRYGNKTGNVKQRNKWTIVNATPLSDSETRKEMMEYLTNGEQN